MLRRLRKTDKIYGYNICLKKWDDFHSACYFIINSRFPHLFSPVFMPNKIVGFFSALGGFSSAYALDTTCADCYKCISWSGSSCLKCEYDEDYCGMGDGGVQQCPKNYIYNSALKKCVCSYGSNTSKPIIIDTPNCTKGPWVGFDTSDSVCACVDANCPSGQQATTTPGVCKDCADPKKLLKIVSDNGQCNAKSDKSLASDTGSSTSVLIEEYTGCYVDTDCVATDETGTFTFSDKCLYKSGGIMI